MIICVPKKWASQLGYKPDRWWWIFDFIVNKTAAVYASDSCWSPKPVRKVVKLQGQQQLSRFDLCSAAAPPPPAETFTQSCPSLVRHIFGCHMKAAWLAAAAPRGGELLASQHCRTCKGLRPSPAPPVSTNRRLFGSRITNDLGWLSFEGRQRLSQRGGTRGCSHGSLQQTKTGDKGRQGGGVANEHREDAKRRN